MKLKSGQNAHQLDSPAHSQVPVSRDTSNVNVRSGFLLHALSPCDECIRCSGFVVVVHLLVLEADGVTIFRIQFKWFMPRCCEIT